MPHHCAHMMALFSEPRSRTQGVKQGSLKRRMSIFIEFGFPQCLDMASLVQEGRGYHSHFVEEETETLLEP